MKTAILLAVSICVIEVHPNLVKTLAFHSGFYPYYLGYPYPHYYHQGAYGIGVLPGADTYHEHATQGYITSPSYSYVRVVRNPKVETESRGEENDVSQSYEETQEKLDAAIKAQNDAPKVEEGFLDKFVDEITKNVPDKIADKIQDIVFQ